MICYNINKKGNEMNEENLTVSSIFYYFKDGHTSFLYDYESNIEERCTVETIIDDSDVPIAIHLSEKKLKELLLKIEAEKLRMQ